MCSRDPLTDRDDNFCPNFSGCFQAFQVIWAVLMKDFFANTSILRLGKPRHLMNIGLVASGTYNKWKPLEKINKILIIEELNLLSTGLENETWTGHEQTLKHTYKCHFPFNFSRNSSGFQFVLLKRMFMILHEWIGNSWNLISVPKIFDYRNQISIFDFIHLFSNQNWKCTIFQLFSKNGRSTLVVITSKPFQIQLPH